MKKTTSLKVSRLWKRYLILFVCLLNLNLVMAQNTKQVSGTVKDESGLALPGVSIVIDKTTNGIITNIDGYYVLEVPTDATLVYSFIGLVTQKILVAGQTKIDVVLKGNITDLDEIIVVGYGTQIKREVTGSIQQVDVDDLKSIPAGQFTQAIQGKVAGVQISQTTGKPGAALQLRIRGQASISASSEPLYVVDGFPIIGGISNINPSEIETITILKDASSTSLYGSRAANGVILITTKSAKSDGLQINVSSYYGVQSVPEKGRPDMMNAIEFAQFQKEYAIENGKDVDPLYQNPEKLGKGTDWYDVLLGTASIQDHNVTLSQRNEKGSFSAVIGYFNQDGVILDTNFKRYSLRLNSTWNLSEKLIAGVNVATNITKDNNFNTDGSLWGGSIIESAILTTPIAKHRNEDGSIPLTATGPGLFPNPNWYNVLKNSDANGEVMGVIANVYLQYEPIKNLRIKSTINADLNRSTYNQFNNSEMGSIFAPPPRTIYAKDETSRHQSWLTEHTVTYKKEIDKHTFDGLVGFSAQKMEYNELKASASNYPDELIRDFSATPNDKRSVDNAMYEWSLISYLSRFNYNYDGKYFASFAIRRDGSSRFGVDNQYGNFPSASVGWIASEEKFMKKFDFINLLKLRASVGVTGNNNIGNYSHKGFVETSNSVFNNNIANGRRVSSIGNKKLNWEKTKQIDLGFDLGLLSNRINLSYDFYQKNTTELLFEVPIPNASGFGNILTNLGELKFWGHEIVLNTKVLTGAFKLDVDLNYSYNDNEILELDTPDGELKSSHHINRVGSRLGLFYAPVHEGVYKNQAEFDKYAHHTSSDVGSVRYRDVDGDGEINLSKDRDVVGNSVPTNLFGFTLNMSYKNWDLSVVGSGASGYKVANVVEEYTGNLDAVFNVDKRVANRWRSPENPGDGKFGKLLAGTSGINRTFNSSFLYDASHLIIKNVNLGYNVPLASQVIKKLRVYGSVQQLAVFTDYPGANPEVSAGSAMRGGYDRTAYPVPRTYTFGVNVSF